MKTFTLFVTLAGLILTSSCTGLVFVSDRDGRAQIYKMATTGRCQTNISNNQFTDHFPDVSPDGKKIVFSSLRDSPGENIYIMDIDGSNVRQVTSDNLQRTHPRWGPQGLIAFAYPSYRGNAKIWTVRSDGTGLRQVTKPGPNESDDNGHDFYAGGKKIVFSRYDSSTRRRDLYSIYFDGTQDFERVTNTPNVCETTPVISHDERLLAHRAFYHDTHKDAVRIVKVGSWTLVKEVVLHPPADVNISGITFSRDDSRVFVAIQSSDVPEQPISRKLEVFSIKVDGTDQKRLTNNAVGDYDPTCCILSYRFWCR